MSPSVSDPAGLSDVAQQQQEMAATFLFALILLLLFAFVAVTTHGRTQRANLAELRAWQARKDDKSSRHSSRRSSFNGGAASTSSCSPSRSGSIMLNGEEQLKQQLLAWAATSSWCARHL